MAVKLDLLPRKVFEITIDEKVIRGKFGTWALRRFCDIKKLSLTALNERFLKQDTSLSDVLTMVLCAVEYQCRIDKIPFEYNDLDVSEWVDELGGIYSVAVGNLFNHAGPEEPEEAPDSEKKSPLNGQASSEPLQGQEAQ